MNAYRMKKAVISERIVKKVIRLNKTFPARRLTND
jgi:hypothetical protein